MTPGEELKIEALNKALDHTRGTDAAPADVISIAGEFHKFLSGAVKPIHERGKKRSRNNK
jgi:hypothetical protein